jgi:Domain of unknown function (DUF4168)
MTFLKHSAWMAAFAATVGLGTAIAQEPTAPPSPSATPPASATPEQRESMPPAQQSTEPDAATPSDEPATTDTMPGQTAQAAPIDDKKIEQFADAYLAVQSIQQNAANELQTTSDPAKADQVKQKAETAMIGAVEKSGLKVDEFNHIVESMAADANLRERVSAKLQQRSGGGR